MFKMLYIFQTLFFCKRKKTTMKATCFWQKRTIISTSKTIYFLFIFLQKHNFLNVIFSRKCSLEQGDFHMNFAYFSTFLGNFNNIVIPPKKSTVFLALSLRYPKRSAKHRISRHYTPFPWFSNSTPPNTLPPYPTHPTLS